MLVQTVAVAVGSMPLTVGYVGVIPALERLLKTNEGGPISVSMPKLILWGIGVAFFGVFFAVPLRRQVIIREKLKFPSGTATALMYVHIPDPCARANPDWRTGSRCCTALKRSLK